MNKYDKNEIYNKLTEKIGLTPKLLSSTRDKIPDNIKQYLPKELFVDIIDNKPYIKQNGYGLLGTSRIGKSCTNAVIIMSCLKGLIKRLVDYVENKGNDSQAINKIKGNLTRCISHDAHKIANWVYWPDCYDWLQKNAITDFGTDRLPRYHTECLKKTNLLILDDLGRESFSKKSSDNGIPYAHGQLALVINYRNEHNLPIIWTSNLEEIDLINIYGAPMYLRLVELAPPSEWLSRIN